MTQTDINLSGVQSFMSAAQTRSVVPTRADAPLNSQDMAVRRSDESASSRRVADIVELSGSSRTPVGDGRSVQGVEAYQRTQALSGDGSGPLSAPGAMAFEGAMAFDGAMDFDGAMQFDGALNSGAAEALRSAGGNGFEGAMAFDGAMDFDGAMQFDGALNSGAAEALRSAGGNGFEGAMAFDGAMDFDGAMQFDGGLNSGAAEALRSAGGSGFEGAMAFDGAMDFDGALSGQPNPAAMTAGIERYQASLALVPGVPAGMGSQPVLGGGPMSGSTSTGLTV